MKPAAALRHALDNPHLYNDDELKKLRNKLEEINYEKQYDQWYRRTRQGFFLCGSSYISWKKAQGFSVVKASPP